MGLFLLLGFLAEDRQDPNESNPGKDAYADDHVSGNEAFSPWEDFAFDVGLFDLNLNFV